MKTETYYIVSVEAKETLDSRGDTMVREGSLYWIGESDGYPANTSNKAWAKKFKYKPSQEDIDQYSGWPWCIRHKKGGSKIYRVHHTTYEDKYEEELIGS